MRPGGQDLWNGELYARSDDKWGSLGRDGTLRLNEALVLRHLTGGELSDDPSLQAQALATVLHESRHARAAVDAPAEPNALRQPQSIGLDEGLIELGSIEDFAAFAQQAGYEGVPQPKPEYKGAVDASTALLERAASSDSERSALLSTAVDQPVVMRWDVVADSIVRNELADIVPSDADHQQAARAHLTTRMAVPGWDGIQHRPNAGPIVAADTKAAVDTAVGELRVHYQQSPDEPYPAKVPNPMAAITAEADTRGSQQRASSRSDHSESVDLTELPPPSAATRVDAPSTQSSAASVSQQLPRELRFLNDQAPAAQATRPGPALGDGARGAGAPHTPSISRSPTSRTPSTGRD
jgi:hypothetical protein